MNGPAAMAKINGETVACRHAEGVRGFAWLCLQAPNSGPSKMLPKDVTVFTQINRHLATCRFSSKFDTLDMWACIAED
jgi:hypothetical protein